MREYVRQVGPGSEATLGSSLVKPFVGAVRTRRIDIRTDTGDYLTAALPHELCHVVLADHFRDGPPPLWFDEGVAIQYDRPEKQRLHERDLQIGLGRGTAMPIVELLNLESYPPAAKWDVFYGQSGALVRDLLTQSTAKELLSRVKNAPRGGVAVVLRNAYQLKDWRDLSKTRIVSENAVSNPQFLAVSALREVPASGH